MKGRSMDTMHGNSTQPTLLSRTIQSLKRRGFRRTILRILKYPFDGLLFRHKERRVFSLRSIEDRFTEIYKLNYWDHEESVSGSASTLFYTENLRGLLPDLFAKFSIQSVFDAPCGDFNWMKHILKNYPIKYIGGDIVLPLIEGHNKSYKALNIEFVHIDLTKSRFPSVDLMICRDCLFHLSYEDAKAVLANFIESNIRFLLTTTHINSDEFINKNITTGGFRRIDLFLPPYNFPKDVQCRIFDWRDPIPGDWREPEPKREMCLWSREQVVATLKRFE